MKKTNTALLRPDNHASDRASGRAPSNDIQQPATGVPQDVARTVAQTWMNIQALDNVLMESGVGIVPWRAAPQVQNAAAAVVADMIDARTCVVTSGFQPHGWMLAAGNAMADVACVHLGKKLPTNVLHMSVEDVAANFRPGVVTIVAMHMETSNGWNDVRTISAAAVKAETPMLMVVSTAVPAPEGVTINVVRDWPAMAGALRDAVTSVRGMGTIRVVAIDDMTVSALESGMMDAAAMTPGAWAEAAVKNNDGADIAMNTAYQAPVESF